jgi:hypothetical protein
LIFNAGLIFTATPRTGKTPTELSNFISEPTKQRRKLESIIEETAKALHSRSSSNNFFQMFMM